MMNFFLCMVAILASVPGIKTAVTLALFGGVAIEFKDKPRQRGDINVCFDCSHRYAIHVRVILFSVSSATLHFCFISVSPVSVSHVFLVLSCLVLSFCFAIFYVSSSDFGDG